MWLVGRGTVLVIAGSLLACSEAIVDVDDLGSADDSGSLLPDATASLPDAQTPDAGEHADDAHADDATEPDAGSTFIEWRTISSTNAPAERVVQVGARVGDVVVIWGGANFTMNYRDGSRYDPAADSWSRTRDLGAPTTRGFPCGVAVGGLFVLWGGLALNRTAPLDGGRYDPILNQWTSTSTIGAPGATIATACASTGDRLFYWGGVTPANTVVASGALYDPIANSWTTISTAGAPSQRFKPATVWTGTEVILWGGIDAPNGRRLVDGYAYNPKSNTWRRISDVGAPSARSDQGAVWTGSTMLIWGGTGARRADLGVEYDPVADSWRALPPGPLFQALREPSMVVNDGWVLMLGGGDASGLASPEGAWYSLTTRTWRALTPPLALGRYGATAVPVPGGAFVWGGYAANRTTQPGGEIFFTPPR